MLPRYLLSLLLALLLAAPRLTPAAPLPPRRLPVGGQLATGLDHSLLLRPNGTLYASGSNGFGQLGDGTTSQRTTPVVVGQGVVPAGVRLTQVAAGNSFSLALGSNGLVYAWGSNVYGQLGDGSTTNRPSPVAVLLPAGVRVVQVAAGQYHSLALAADGTAYTWGYNNSGQLGDGSTTDRSSPVAVAQGTLPTGTRLAQVAAGGYYGLALAADGTAYAWGRNNSGQLGDGSSTQRTTPVAVSQGAQPAGTRLAQLGGGCRADHALALAADGTAYAWGYNNSGQLGRGSTTNSLAPVAPLLPDRPYGYQQAAGGGDHSLGLRADGTAYAWGNNGNGQLGDGSTTNRSTPVAVAQGALPTGTKLVQLAAGSLHSVALTADGVAYSWGNNDGDGELGTGGTASSPTPVAVAQGALPATARLRQVAVGRYHTLVLTADGTAYAWGYNNSGQLGKGSAGSALVPVAVAQGALPTGTRLVQLAAGNAHGLALAADGTAYAWGYNGTGGLGDGTTTDRNSPVAVAQGALPTGTKLVQLAAGNTHSLGLAADGTLYAWGDNGNGQLGDGTTTQRTSPVAVTMPSGVRFVQVAAGRNHSLALAADGRLFTWGYNYYGQLGDGTFTQRLVPVAEASGTTAWSQLAAAPLANHSLVLGSGAAVYSAGYNASGQLGNGTTTNSPLFLRNAAPLPVQLVQFSARRAGPATVALAWTTASELQNAGFGVELSPDGTAWTRRAFVAGAGSSVTARSYTYALPETGAAYYRLAQTDQDGTVSYSPTQFVPGTGTALSAYPNPASGRGAMLHGAPAGAAVQVLDLTGRLVLATTTDEVGQTRLSLPAGLYLVQAGGRALRLAVQ